MDLTISQRSNKEGFALVPAANKSDHLGAGGKFEMQRINNELQDSIAQVRSSCGADLRAPSSIIQELALEVREVYKRWNVRVEV